MDGFSILLLILVANGSPVAARILLRERLDAPLDGGKTLADGHRLLGASKTWRGLITALIAATLCAPLLGLTWQLGLVVGVAAMFGDACSSFIKRRLGMPSGAMALGLDHVPESLFPLIASRAWVALSWPEVILLSLAFMIVNLALSRLLFHLGVREHPY